MLDLILYMLIISGLSAATLFIMLSVVCIISKIHDLTRC